jgi:hypothetical protein
MSGTEDPAVPLCVSVPLAHGVPGSGTDGEDNDECYEDPLTDTSLEDPFVPDSDLDLLGLLPVAQVRHSQEPP